MLTRDFILNEFTLIKKESLHLLRSHVKFFLLLLKDKRNDPHAEASDMKSKSM